jgi:Toastrack DUF4097
MNLVMKAASYRAQLVTMLLMLIVIALPAQGSEYEKTFNFDADELKISNLIGQVDVRSGSGDQIRVTVNVKGEDAEAGILEFKVDEGSRSELLILFPTDEHKKYVYPELGRGKTTVSYRDEGDGGSWLKKVMGSGDRITVRGKGSGLEVWADVLVEVPRNRSLEVKVRVGGIQADDVEADLVLDTGSGTIEANGITGDLVADTGSGHVTVTDIEGDLHVDTGSGSVEIGYCTGRTILVDTGSGSVKSDYLDCSDLTIDTGSGRVRADHVKTDSAKIDTGSGSVALQLDRMGTGRFILDTGSGSIVLDLPENASARISADTGSGSMNNELKGALVEEKGRREMTLVVGDGEARVTLDAGSGSVTVK